MTVERIYMGERVLEALRLVSEAIEEHEQELKEHEQELKGQGKRLDQLENIVSQQAEEINNLEEQIRNLRNQSIRSAIDRGVPSHIVAQAHGLSAGRISQIAPRRRN